MFAHELEDSFTAFEAVHVRKHRAATTEEDRREAALAAMGNSILRGFIPSFLLNSKNTGEQPIDILQFCIKFVLMGHFFLSNA